MKYSLTDFSFYEKEGWAGKGFQEELRVKGNKI